MKKPAPQPFVLMSRTGQLLEGYRITFFDNSERNLILEAAHGVSLFYLQHDGWIIYHPEMTAPFFLNLKGEKFFENLGPL